MDNCIESFKTGSVHKFGGLVYLTSVNITFQRGPFEREESEGEKKEL